MSFNTRSSSSSSSCRIRNRYLGKLGIFPNAPPVRMEQPRKRCRVDLGGQCTSTATPLPCEEPSALKELSFLEHQILACEENDIPERSLKGLAFLDSYSSLTHDDDHDNDEESLCEADEEASFYEEEADDDDESLSHSEEDEDETSLQSEDLVPKQVQFFAAVAVVEIPSHRDYDDVSHQSIWTSFRVQEENAKRNILEYHADGRDWRNATEEKDMIRTKKGQFVHPATFKLICRKVKEMTSQRKRRESRPKKRFEVHDRRRNLAFFSNGAPSLTRFADT